MTKWADFCISKVKYLQGTNIIESVEMYPDNGESLGEAMVVRKNTLVQHNNNGKTFVTLTKNEKGKWNKKQVVSFFKNIITGKTSITIGSSNLNKDNLGKIPLLLTRRKTFVSYYHKDDQKYKETFLKLTSDLIVNKSVGKDDINADTSDEYVKQLIQKGFLADTTVMIVLVGAKTKCRMHVDWKISGALNRKVGDHYAGLVGILLPTHPDYEKDEVLYKNLPARLADNFDSGYANIYDWTTDRKAIQDMIEDAFSGRKSRSDKKTNSRIQMKKDTCN